MHQDLLGQSVPLENQPVSPANLSPRADNQLRDLLSVPSVKDIELPPFPIDDYVDAHVKDMTPEKQVEHRNGFTSAMSAIAQPWQAVGYTAAGALNRGMAQFSETMDLLAKFTERAGVGKRGGLFENSAKSFNDNADYWKGRADKVGVGFLEELFGEAVGGAVPGVTDFALKVASGFTIPAVSGAENAMEHDRDPFIGGIMEAVKTGTLAGMFKMIQPFSRYIQATMMGSTFALQGAMTAPEGKELEEGAKGLGTGLLFSSVSSPGGVKLRDIYPELGRTVPEFRKEIEAETAAKEAASKESLAQDETLAVGAAEANFKQPLDDIDQLTQSLESIPKTTSFSDRLNISGQIAKIYQGVMAAPKNAFEKIKSGGAAAWDWYKNSAVELGPLDIVFNKYLGDIQISGMKTKQWAEQIIGTMSREKRTAVANYVAAGGDLQKLRDWAEKSKDAEVKKGYEDALSLTPEEKTFAENIRNYYSAKLDKAVEAEIIDHGVTDYVNQVINKKEDRDKMLAEVNSGLFRKNPSFTKQRIFEHFFDGEQQGYSYEKDIGKLITAYESSFNKAILTRKFIKDLPEQLASDGKPAAIVSGSGTAVPKGETPAEAYLIKPKTIKDEDYGLYKEIPHSAFRAFKWAEKDAEGNPIFVEGNLMVHKEIYKKLKNALTSSAIQQNVVGRALLKGGAFLKDTLLSGGIVPAPFHQVTEYEHAAGHMVNPFNTKPIDVNDPIQRDLIQHELMIYNHDGSALFEEGAASGGLFDLIPALGSMHKEYKEYLFQKKIPEIKMSMAMDAFERNTERYPELSRDQVLTLTSRQANHAFGELNYAAMGRNKTLQDVLRLTTLAPDFLEARAGFAGQALKPYGREQLAALTRLALVNLAVARVIGAVLGDETDRDPVAYAEFVAKHPFSCVIGGKEYGIRTVPGDILHLVSDPRSFIYHRLNPATTKPLIEAVTGRDVWGRKKDVAGQMGDFAKGFVPLPAQGFFQKEDYDLYQSIMQTIGITSWNAPSDAEIAIMELHKQQSEMREQVKKQQEDAMGSEAVNAIKKAKRFSIRN
jgi:hypothetical protein